jgi:hypothetical protein
MARLMIKHTKEDDKSWVVNLDNNTMSEIEAETTAEETRGLMAAASPLIVDSRAYAASHAWFDA